MGDRWFTTSAFQEPRRNDYWTAAIDHASTVVDSRCGQRLVGGDDEPDRVISAYLSRRPRPVATTAADYEQRQGEEGETVGAGRAAPRRAVCRARRRRDVRCQVPADDDRAGGCRDCWGRGDCVFLQEQEIDLWRLTDCVSSMGVGVYRELGLFLGGRGTTRRELVQRDR